MLARMHGARKSAKQRRNHTNETKEALALAVRVPHPSVYGRRRGAIEARPGCDASGDAPFASRGTPAPCAWSICAWWSITGTGVPAIVRRARIVHGKRAPSPPGAALAAAVTCETGGRGRTAPDRRARPGLAATRHTANAASIIRRRTRLAGRLGDSFKMALAVTVPRTYLFPGGRAGGVVPACGQPAPTCSPGVMGGS